MADLSAWRRAQAAHAAAQRNQRNRTPAKPVRYVLPPWTGPDSPQTPVRIEEVSTLSEPTPEAVEPAGDVDPDILTADDDNDSDDAE